MDSILWGYVCAHDISYLQIISVGWKSLLVEAGNNEPWVVSRKMCGFGATRLGAGVGLMGDHDEKTRNFRGFLPKSE